MLTSCDLCVNLNIRNAVICGLLVTQGIYAITQQPSLVPLLTATAFCPECQWFPGCYKAVKKLKVIAYFVLLTWVVSLFCLPLFVKPVQPLVTSGDLSLFWYIMIGTSSFLNTGFVITAAYTVLAALVAAYIIHGITREEESEEAEKASEDITDDTIDA